MVASPSFLSADLRSASLLASILLVTGAATARATASAFLRFALYAS